MIRYAVRESSDGSLVALGSTEPHEVRKNVFEPLLGISKKGYRVEGLGVIKNTLKRDNAIQDILLLNIIKATRLVRSGMR